MAYATGAVVAGGAARAGLAAHLAEVRAVASVILALVGVHGLWALTRGRRVIGAPRHRLSATFLGRPASRLLSTFALSG